MSLASATDALAARTAVEFKKRGVPAGGTAGQLLARAAGNDYATTWVDAPAGGTGGGSLSLVTVSSVGQLVSMPATPAAGDVVTLVLRSGGGSVVWNFPVIWDGGTSPTLSTVLGDKDVVTFVYDGETWLGFVSGAFPAPAADLSGTMLALGPIAYWKMDDSAGTTMADSSGFGRDGTWVGTPGLGQSAPGALGAATYFNGTDTSATVPAASWMNTQQVTMVAFIRATRLDGMILAAKGTGAWQNPYRIQLNAQGLFGIGHATGVQSDGARVVIGTGQMVDTGWHMVVGVIRPGVDVKLYVDGALSPITTNQGLFQFIGDWTQDMQIGARYTSRSVFYQGDLAHLAVFNKALTQAEISAIYDASGLGA